MEESCPSSNNLIDLTTEVQESHASKHDSPSPTETLLDLLDTNVAG